MISKSISKKIHLLGSNYYNFNWEYTNVFIISLLLLIFPYKSARLFVLEKEDFRLRKIPKYEFSLTWLNHTFKTGVYFY